jgi:hypothetical protein
MPVQADFQMVKWEDGILTISMTPSVPVGGWDVAFVLDKRFGNDLSSGLVNKSMASGYQNGVSGITLVNSGAGVFNVQINSSDTSGLEPGNYAYRCDRRNSGSYTRLAEGFLILGT